MLLLPLVQCIPIVCCVAQAYALNLETMIMLQEHHPDDWHAAYRGWAVIAIMLVGGTRCARIAALRPARASDRHSRSPCSPQCQRAPFP